MHKIVIGILLSCLLLQANAQTPGPGPWLFGMSKAEISKFESYGPYKDVLSTGGVETPNGIFNGKKTYISFLFDDKGLKRIQVWAYEGRSIDDATEAWKSTYQYLQKTYGAIEVPQIKLDPKSDPLTAETLSIAIKAHVGILGKVQMAPKTMPAEAVVFSSFIKHEIQGSPYYYVFAYFNRP